MTDLPKDITWRNAVTDVDCDKRENKETCLHPEWWWKRDEAGALTNLREMPPVRSKCLLCTQGKLQKAEAEIAELKKIVCCSKCRFVCDEEGCSFWETPLPDAGYCKEFTQK